MAFEVASIRLALRTGSTWTDDEAARAQARAAAGLAGPLPVATAVAGIAAAGGP